MKTCWGVVDVDRCTVGDVVRWLRQSPWKIFILQFISFLSTRTPKHFFFFFFSPSITFQGMPTVTCECGSGHCKEHCLYEEGKREAGWNGVRPAALCIGVGTYDTMPSTNARTDAVALFKKINECTDCRAAIVKDPDSRITVIDCLIRFLHALATLPADKLPEVVLIFLAGHGLLQAYEALSY